MPPKKKVGKSSLKKKVVSSKKKAALSLKPSRKRVTLKRKSGKVASITPLKEGLKDIQEKRNELCYGTPKKEKEIVDYIKKFNKLKEIFESLGVKNEK